MKCCQTAANSAEMKDWGTKEGAIVRAEAYRVGIPSARLLQASIVQLSHSPENPLGGPFEIRAVQGWQLVAIGNSMESHALCGRANRLEIGRSQPVETFGNIFNR